MRTRLAFLLPLLLLAQGAGAQTTFDFNGDGRADVLWRNASSGENYLYPMNGTAILGTEGYLRTVADQNWQVAGIGDFDGDGKADILWRNFATGENYLYFMDGTAIKPAEGYVRTVADQAWQVAGVGDFDGDGKDDILWRNGSTGENYLYPMDGLAIKGTEGYLRTVADQSWQIAGAGDFDGDGKADVLWRNGATGENYLYPMDGLTIKVTEGYLRTVADQSWQVVGVGDFGNDGRADILWRNASTGENYLYPMNGTTILGGEGYLRTVADQNWQVAAVGDYDADGNADILWRNNATGENYVYPMHGTAILAGEGFTRTVADSAWQPVGTDLNLTVLALSKTAANPFSLVTVTGAGIKPHARLFVRFFDATGYSLEVPAVRVTSTAVSVATPPYFDVAFGGLSYEPAMVGLELVQRAGAKVRRSAAIPGFIINALQFSPLGPGQTTERWLETLQILAPDARTRLQMVESRYPGAPSTAALRGQLAALEAQMTQLRGAITVSGDGSPQSLGTFRGAALTLDIETLFAMDDLVYAAVLAFGPNSPSPCAQKDAYTDQLWRNLKDSQYVEGQARYVGSAITCTNAELLDFSEKMGAVVAVLGVAAVAAGVGLSLPAIAALAFLAMAPATFVMLTETEAISLSGASEQAAKNLKGAVQQFQDAIFDPLATSIMDVTSPATSMAYQTLLAAKAVGDQAKGYVATFDIPLAFTFPPIGAPTYSLSLGTTGTGAGTVAASPGGLNYASGTTVTLTAIPDPGSVFAGWSGSCPGACQMSADRAALATFNADDPEVSCCIANAGCPGETGDECGATCCCCGPGFRCCADWAGGCCFVGGAAFEPDFNMGMYASYVGSCVQTAAMR